MCWRGHRIKITGDWTYGEVPSTPPLPSPPPGSLIITTGLTMDREVFRLRDTLSARFADLCYNGFWFSPEMEFINHAVRKSQEVRYSLYVI